MSHPLPNTPPGAFPIDLSTTTELIERFHRTLMDRRNRPEWEAFDPSVYPDELVAHARVQWAGRAVAEYHSTAQFGQLLHRLTCIGAPIELIGAATRLAQDECRHAELCARMADALGGRDRQDVPSRGLSLYDEGDDLWLQIAQTILSVCCMGETLSVPMLYALEQVSTDPLAETVSRIIAADEEYHARFGWEALTWLIPRLDDAQRDTIQRSLPVLLSHFEAVCASSPELLEQLAGEDVEIEPGDPAHPNLGTLTNLQYAAIFYHTIEAEILPGLDALGFDALGAWQTRPRAA